MTALIPAIAVGLVFGYFLHRATRQRDALVKLLARTDEALRDDARRIRVLRDDNIELIARMQAASDDLLLLSATRARLAIEIDECRHALAVQIVPPGERMSLLGENVVAIRKTVGR